MKHTFIVSAVALVGALAATAGAYAAEDHKHHQPPTAEKPSSVRVKYDDAVLTDQNGRQIKFKTDVIGDKIVVIDFVYTTCTTVCPVLTALMAKVQGELGEEALAEVQFISVTVDPARDTPARLKEYAAKYGAKPGWVWLTGPTGRVNAVLKGFGAYAPNFEDHPPLVLVGDARSGQWTRFFGFGDPKDLLAKIRDLRDARAGAHEGHAATAKDAKAAPAAAAALKPKRDPQAYFTDRELITQDGVKVRFYSDVLKGRMVVLSTMFTHCEDACPLITAQLKQVRANLGDDFGKDIFFVAISSDPVRDTPQALKKYAAKHKADAPGWIYLTGTKADVDFLLKKLGQWSEHVESHSTQLIAWNFNTDRGRKLLPNLPPEALAEHIKALAGGDALMPVPSPDVAAPKAN